MHCTTGKPSTAVSGFTTGVSGICTGAGVRLWPDGTGGDGGVGTGGAWLRATAGQDSAIWTKWRNTMTRDEQHLDGNAAGSVLGQIFAFEMTTA